MERIKKQNVILLEARFILLTSTLPSALFLEDFSFASILFFFFLLHFLFLSLCGSPREQLASPSRMGGNGAVLPLGAVIASSALKPRAN